MEHSSPCPDLIEIMKAGERRQEKLDSTHKWVKSIDDECEKIKIDVNKLKIHIAILATTASFIGGMLGGWVGKAMQNLTFSEIIDIIISFFC